MSAQTLFEQIKNYGAENKSIVSIFDLDSTLFNVSYRTQKILFEFAQQLTHEDLRDKLLKTYVKQSDWGLKETLMNSGLEYSQFPEFFHQLRDYWVERFFSSRYLHFDVPTKGAVVFAHQLVDLGLANDDLIYLTGRDEFRMGPGTREVLKKWNFPEGRVVLKPSKELDDGQFKLNWLCQLISQSEGKTILFFENEPVNINLIGKKFPNVNIIFINTTHSRREEIEVPVIEIDHFDTNVEME